MAAKKLAEMQKRILANPYTNGKIKTLVAVEHEGGTDYVLDWVKNGKAETFDADANHESISTTPTTTALPYVAAPIQLPDKLKYNGPMTIGKDHEAVINGVTFAAGDQKRIKLKGATVTVHCLEIRDDGVVVQINDSPEKVTLSAGDEMPLP